MSSDNDVFEQDRASSILNNHSHLTSVEHRFTHALEIASNTDYPRDSCVHQLFEEQAARTPDAIAVEYRDQHLSYAELNRRANRLAHTLRKCGVGPDSLVGLCIPRSLEMVVGLLGILKAGGAYVPLDPSYPAERLQFILKDALITVLLTQSSLQALFDSTVRDANPPIQQLFLEEVSINSADSSAPPVHDENPLCFTRPHNLAYAIYTSGSTGKPKGVPIHHQGLVNYLSWCIEAYRVKEGTGAPVHSPLGFDLTVTSLFAPLLAGKRVLLIPEEEGIDGLCQALRNVQAGEEFSLVKITPAHIEILRHRLPVSAASSAKAFVIGGEALVGEALSYWRDNAPATRIINEYGPTETVVGCCIYELLAGHSKPGPVPIGRPIANTQLYILDEAKKPVAVGVSGELFIGGEGVAHGYLNRPELTVERFLPDPFSSRSGALLYRSGDLVRQGADGALEFLGRIDQQVKLRGYRIELGEIEAALEQQNTIRKAAVIIRGEGETRRLVAYLVTTENVPLDIDSIRAGLSRILPEYMLPTSFVRLDDMPLTANGKIDRKALPDVDNSFQPETRAGNRTAPPCNPVQARLARLWCDLLKISNVGIHEDFFQLGGTSLLAARLMDRITKEFGKDLPLSILAQAPTIEKLGEIVAGEESHSSWTSLVPIQPAGSRVPLYCIPGGGGTVLEFYDLARLLGVEQPVYGLQAQGMNGRALPHRTIEEAADHYIWEIRTVQPAGPYNLCGYCFGGLIAYEMARKLVQEGEAVGLVALINATVPRFDRSELKPPPPGVRGRLVGMTRKSWRAFKRIEKQVEQERLRLGIQISQALKRTVPNEIRGRNIRTSAFLAEMKYTPAVHSGSISLFTTDDVPAHMDLGWGQLVKGSVKIHTIHGPVKSYRDILREPLILSLAAKLQECLEEAAPQNGPVTEDLDKPL